MHGTHAHTHTIIHRTQHTARSHTNKAAAREVATPTSGSSLGVPLSYAGEKAKDRKKRVSVCVCGGVCVCLSESVQTARELERMAVYEPHKQTPFATCPLLHTPHSPPYTHTLTHTHTHTHIHTHRRPPGERQWRSVRVCCGCRRAARCPTLPHASRSASTSRLRTSATVRG